MRNLITTIVLMVFFTIPNLLYTAEDKPSAAELKKKVAEANVILDVVAKGGIEMSEKAYRDIIPLLQEEDLNLPFFIHPGSKAVQTAETKYSDELIKLREQYLAAVMKAQQKYVTVLDREIKREEGKKKWEDALALQIRKSDTLNEKGVKVDFLGKPIEPLPKEVALLNVNRTWRSEGGDVLQLNKGEVTLTLKGGSPVKGKLEQRKDTFVIVFAGGKERALQKNKDDSLRYTGGGYDITFTLQK